MSRIGLKPIMIPSGVEVTLGENNEVTVKGPKGTLTNKFNNEMIIKKEESTIVVERPTENKKHKSLHGLTRTLINNMGVGYRAAKQGKKLVMNLGFSHPVEMDDPEGITTEVPNQFEIIVKGIDKQQVGNYASVIRAWRKPEPYKGKGIKYADEVIIRKEGKTGKK